MQSGQHINGKIDTPAFEIGLAELYEGMKRQLGHLLGEHTHQPVKAMKTNCEITFQSLTPETLLQLLSMLSLLVLLSFGLCRETCSQKQQGKSCEGFILVRNVGDICFPHSPPHCQYQPPHCQYQPAPHYPPPPSGLFQICLSLALDHSTQLHILSSPLPFSGGVFTPTLSWGALILAITPPSFLCLVAVRVSALRLHCFIAQLTLKRSTFFEQYWSYYSVYELDPH